MQLPEGPTILFTGQIRVGIILVSVTHFSGVHPVMPPQRAGTMHFSALTPAGLILVGTTTHFSAFRQAITRTPTIIPPSAQARAQTTRAVQTTPILAQVQTAEAGTPVRF